MWRRGLGLRSGRELAERADMDRGMLDRAKLCRYVVRASISRELLATLRAHQCEDQVWSSRGLLAMPPLPLPKRKHLLQCLGTQPRSNRRSQHLPLGQRRSSILQPPRGPQTRLGCPRSRAPTPAHPRRRSHKRKPRVRMARAIAHALTARRRIARMRSWKGSRGKQGWIELNTMGTVWKYIITIFSM